MADSHRLALVGTGKISEIHADAVALVDGLDIAAGYDPRGQPSWWQAKTNDAPFASSLEALAAEGCTAFVVATPSGTHPTVARDLLDLAPDALVLVEKPLATTRTEADEILASTRAGRVVPLYHAAYAPEVTWASEHLDQLVDRHGAMVRYVSFFSDPLDTTANRAQARASYENSWFDSGSNALSVLLRLRLIASVEHVTWKPDHGSTAAVAARGPTGETGTIITQWTVTTPSKSTTLTLADGTLVVLDHQATGARVVAPTGSVETVVGWTADIPRLVRHYAGLFQHEVVDQTSIFTADDHATLVTMLFDAMT